MADYISAYTGEEIDNAVKTVSENSEKWNGAVPSTRTINGKALSGDISLGAGDVEAAPSETVFASPSTDGWYRVGTLYLMSDRGVLAGHTQLTIGGIYANRNPEPFVVDIYHRYGAASLRQRPAYGSPSTISKVRLVKEDDTIFHVDVYKMYTAGNPLYINFQPTFATVTVGNFENVTDSTETVVESLDLARDGYLSGYVPNGRKINGKYLDKDVTLGAADVGAPTVDEMNTAISSAIGDAIGGSY